MKSSTEILVEQSTGFAFNCLRDGDHFESSLHYRCAADYCRDLKKAERYRSIADMVECGIYTYEGDASLRDLEERVAKENLKRITKRGVG